jgi:hypothetical protein
VARDEPLTSPSVAPTWPGGTPVAAASAQSDAADTARGVPQYPVAACAPVETAMAADRPALAGSRDQGTTGEEAAVDAQKADRRSVVPTGRHRWRQPPVAVWSSPPAVPPGEPDAERAGAEAWSSWDAALRCASESLAARHALAAELLRVRAPAGLLPLPVPLVWARRPVLRQAEEVPVLSPLAQQPSRQRQAAPAQAAVPRRAHARAVLRQRVRAAPRRRAARPRPRASRFSPGAAEAAPGQWASAAPAPSSRAPASCLSERASRRRCRRWAA